MSKKISFIVRNDPELLNDKIFSSAELYGMKSDNYCFIAIKDRLNQLGHEIHTQDILPPQDADIILCLDQVGLFKSINVLNKPSYLIISEPAVYCPDNWLVENHVYFEKIFTYNRDLITSDKYVRYTLAFDFDPAKVFSEISLERFHNRKLLCLIAGSIQVTRSEPKIKSLLYERYLAADYFSKYHCTEFDVYGRNLIDKKFECFKGARYLKMLKLNPLVKLIAQYKARNIKKSFKGAVPALGKLEYQNQYNFSLCYDNSEINGFVSERIIDCFLSKSLPVYLGPADITDYVPDDCFIDRRKFKNNRQLYSYIKNMPFEEYSAYLKAINNFLNSSRIDIFKTDHYANTITLNMNLDE
ncbi:glycosyltransferase family 10 domain-containing protein [Mucilaginibacter sp. AW1-3]